MNRFEELPESEKVDRYTRLACKALSAYGLADAKLTYLGGAANSTFEVATGDPSRHYVLRLCPPEQALDALQREILWLTALCRDTNLVIPEPILSMDGELVRRVAIAGVPGFRPCVLLRWVAGESRNRELAPVHLRSVGRLMAALHSHAETFRWPDEIAPLRRDATRISGTVGERLLRTHYNNNQVAVFRRAIERVGTMMVELGSGSNVAGAIHGQLNPRHLVFQEGVARAIGFETCRWGYYAYDLATIRSYVAGREGGGELVAALLDGYRALRDLPESIERRLSVFAALRSIDRVQSMLAKPERGGRITQDLDNEYEELRRIVEAA